MNTYDTTDGSRRTGVALGAMRRQAGFTLVELMVGAVLAMITVALIAQVYALSEGRKRTSTSGTDAQVNGTLALYSLTRDLQMAGYGLTIDKEAIGCPVKASYDTTDLATFPLAPVVITQNIGTTHSDRIAILSSAKSSFSVPMRVISNHSLTDDHFVVQSTLGASEGDLMVAVPRGYSAANWCTLFQVKAGSGTNPLDTQDLPHTINAAAKWNTKALANFPASGYPATSDGSTSSFVVNLGPMIYRTYEVSSNQVLQTSDVTSASGTATTRDLYSQIVLIKALYGKDTDMASATANNVDSYDAVTPTDATGWQQVKAVRIAVVARSTQYEKDEVTSVEPQWDVGTGVPVDGATTCTNGNTNSRCIQLSLSQLGSDWKHYRYRVYDTVVPLRNTVWTQ